MSTGFREFPQIPRGRGFSLLEFYSSFKYHVNVSDGCGLERPSDRFQTLEPECLDFETHEQSVSVLRTVWVKCVMNGSINHVLVCMRAEMAVKFWFTK